VQRVEAQTDYSRYLYMMQVGQAADDADGDEEGASGPAYKRYKLSDEKTFNSLFFAQKARLLHLLGHFKERTGKFAIPGCASACLRRRSPGEQPGGGPDPGGVSQTRTSSGCCCTARRGRARPR
jgi:hypothetical protein